MRLTHTRTSHAYMQVHLLCIVYTRIHARAFVHTYTHARTYIFAHPNTHIHTFIHICIRSSMPKDAYIHTHTHTYTHTHTRTYTSTYTYIHIHTQDTDRDSRVSLSEWRHIFFHGVPQRPLYLDGEPTLKLDEPVRVYMYVYVCVHEACVYLPA